VEPLDRALELLRDTHHPDFGNTHGPMGAEALVGLGHPERVLEWARDFREQLTPNPPGRPFPTERWREALGKPDQLGDWVALFDCEIDREGWRKAARLWLPRFLPAASCAAGHGLIRTAHALRSLAHSDTPPRRHELAEALGFWGADYEELSGEPGGGRPGPVSQAIASVPVVPADQQRWDGLITDRLRETTALPGFADAVSALEPSGPASDFLDDLSLCSARLYLANAPRARAIDFIHAVDGVACLRELVPYLGSADQLRALFYGWQLVAALQASAGGPLEPAELAPPPPAEVPSWVERAVSVGGPHALKFAQACLLEHARQPDPIYHAALADMVLRMEQLRDRLGILV